MENQDEDELVGGIILATKRILAISGSLRKPSFTEKMLDKLIEGMGEAVEVQKFYPHKMNIGPCNSCWSCWGKKEPAVCVQKDDFEQILAAYKEADYLLWAFPLYVFDMPATVKNVLDRLFVTLEPAQQQGPDGLTEHPKRFHRERRAVLISSCGFPEIENFDLLRKHFHLMCQHLDWQWAGEVLISASGAANVPQLFDTKYELIKKAGTELVNGCISSETSKAIGAAVIAAEDYRQMATAYFAGGIGGKLKQISLGMKAIQESKKKSQ